MDALFNFSVFIDNATTRYILIYGLIIICSLFTDALAKIIWSISSLGASRVIHDRLLESIFSATFRYVYLTCPMMPVLNMQPGGWILRLLDV